MDGHARGEIDSCYSSCSEDSSTHTSLSRESSDALSSDLSISRLNIGMYIDLPHSVRLSNSVSLVCSACVVWNGPGRHRNNHTVLSGSVSDTYESGCCGE